MDIQYYNILEVKERQEFNGKGIESMEVLEEMTEKVQKTMFISAYMNVSKYHKTKTKR